MPAREAAAVVELHLDKEDIGVKKGREKGVAKQMSLERSEMKKAPIDYVTSRLTEGRGNLKASAFLHQYFYYRRENGWESGKADLLAVLKKLSKNGKSVKVKERASQWIQNVDRNFQLADNPYKQLRDRYLQQKLKDDMKNLSMEAELTGMSLVTKKVAKIKKRVMEEDEDGPKYPAKKAKVVYKVQEYDDEKEDDDDDEEEEEDDDEEGQDDGNDEQEEDQEDDDGNDESDKETDKEEESDEEGQGPNAGDLLDPANQEDHPIAEDKSKGKWPSYPLGDGITLRSALRQYEQSVQGQKESRIVDCTRTSYLPQARILTKEQLGNLQKYLEARDDSEARVDSNPDEEESDDDEEEEAKDSDAAITDPRIAELLDALQQQKKAYSAICFAPNCWWERTYIFSQPSIRKWRKQIAHREALITALEILNPILTQICSTERKVRQTGNRQWSEMQGSINMRAESIPATLRKLLTKATGDNKQEAKKARDSLREMMDQNSRFKGYNHKRDRDWEWVRRILLKFIDFVETPRNPLVDQNSEAWISTHVLAPLVDDLLFGVPELQVVRGEISSLSSSIRKQKKSGLEQRKPIGRKTDGTLRVRGQNKLEMGHIESKPHEKEDAPKEARSDKSKLLRLMKDALDRLIELQSSHLVGTQEVERVHTFGIQSSARTMDHFDYPTIWEERTMILAAIKAMLTFKHRLVKAILAQQRMVQEKTGLTLRGIRTISPDLPETFPTPKKAAKKRK
ncbi:hypothetical protein HK104_000844 [Borealophlyctis nickersoniae]|nr:hypothetical protein HK104_000844 [Borealophlyctis nickersoniae]